LRWHPYWLQKKILMKHSSTQILQKNYRLRIIRMKFYSPELILKKCVLKEEERIKRQRQVPSLARSARLEIRERVRTQLVSKSVPVPAVYDLCWNLSEGTLFFFSTSKKAMVLLEDLFRESFDLSLVLQIPWLIAGHLADDAAGHRLDDLRPAILV